MKKYPEKNDRWTRWFFPFTSYLPTLWREKFPHLRPGPEKLAKYRRIYNGLTFIYIGIGWSAIYYIYYKYYGDENVQSKDQNTANIAALARSGWGHGGSKWLDPSKTAKVITWENGGWVTKDVTDEVRAYALGEKYVPENNYDKYKDYDYLSDRAGIKKDDPQFDPDYLATLFKRLDQKRNEGVKFN